MHRFNLGNAYIYRMVIVGMLIFDEMKKSLWVCFMHHCNSMRKVISYVYTNEKLKQNRKWKKNKKTILNDLKRTYQRWSSFSYFVITSVLQVNITLAASEQMMFVLENFPLSFVNVLEPHSNHFWFNCKATSINKCKSGQKLLFMLYLLFT